MQRELSRIGEDKKYIYILYKGLEFSKFWAMNLNHKVGSLARNTEYILG